jgi:hypothetical protein
MDPHITTLERAFQLAMSGQCRSVDEIKRKLNSEGYSAAQVTGKGLLSQLHNLIRQGSQTKRAEKAPVAVASQSNAQLDQAPNSTKPMTAEAPTI